MKKTLIPFFFFLFLLSCTNHPEPPQEALSPEPTFSAPLPTPSVEPTPDPYDTYFQSLLTFSNSLATYQETAPAITQSFLEAPTDPEALHAQIESLQTLVTLLSSTDELFSFSSIEDAHKPFVDSAQSFASLLQELISLLEDDFNPSHPETFQALQAFQNRYSTQYIEFSTALYALTDAMIALSS